MRQDRPPTRRDRSFASTSHTLRTDEPHTQKPCPERPAARGPALSAFAGFPQIIIARTDRTIGQSGWERQETGRNPNSREVFATRHRSAARRAAPRRERAASFPGRITGGVECSMARPPIGRRSRRPRRGRRDLPGRSMDGGAASIRRPPSSPMSEGERGRCPLPARPSIPLVRRLRLVVVSGLLLVGLSLVVVGGLLLVGAWPS